MAIFFPGSNFKLSKTGRNFNLFFIIAAIVIITALAVTLFIWKPVSGIPGRGVWNGRTYANRETGISLVVPGDWQIKSDADIIESFNYSPDIYKDLGRYSDYVDAFISKTDDSKLYIRFYDVVASSATALDQAQLSARQLKSPVNFGAIRLKAIPEDITAVEIGGLTYERFAYTLAGIDNARFIEYYRCLEGDTGEIFVQLNLTIFDETTEGEFLALFKEMQ
ncbi:MAG TPA: hypothetical protein PK854_10415 [Oscillospiraceae bacterium]|nr:hypothetical protein [Oscillospiraceae bacterium]HPS35664.1 hypothetical protein [Oscillospiraceae bacterium]